MKKIVPIQAWKNGEQLEANLLNVYIIRDDLQTYCEFYYSLNTSGEGTEQNPLIVGKILAEGKITIDGENYLAWDGDNNYAFTYIAEKLNLTLI
jgi:hypothetical protein